MANRRALRCASLVLFALPACSERVIEPPAPLLAEVPDHYELVNQDAESALLLARNDLLVNLVLENSRYGFYRRQPWSQVMTAVTTRIYTGIPDAFDFLIITFDPDDPRTDPPLGAESTVRNDVRGLGYPEFDDGYRYGADFRLRSVVMLWRPSSLRGGPSLHEIAHAWGATLTQTVRQGHWGFSGVGGQLGGWVTGSLEQIEPGMYRGYGPTGRPFHTDANGGNRLPYAPLELYMMGFLSPDSVPPIEVAEGAEWADSLDGRFTADTIRVFTIERLLEGRFPARMPSHVDAPRHFRALYVVLSKAPLGAQVLDALAHDVEQFSLHGPDDRDDIYNFWEATGGRATMDFGIRAQLR